MARAERRQQVTDVRALRALADPVRYRLLGHLMAVGPRTASQCAEYVGATASNCSYHLRELARYGLIERAEGAADGRERLWQAAATGFGFGDAHDTEPAAATAALALSHVQLDAATRDAHAAIDRASSFSPQWRDAVSMAGYALRISAAELAALEQAVDELIRPYIALTREDAPPDAAAVHLGVTAYPLETP
jgi:DNA-binding MarR family transcriptional regulator